MPYKVSTADISVGKLDELKHICDLTVELTRLRQNKVGHLSIEDFAPELLGKLLRELKLSKNTTV